jgi:hypothetical protein
MRFIVPISIKNQQTAAPTAINKKIDIMIYDAKNIDFKNLNR